MNRWTAASAGLALVALAGAVLLTPPRLASNAPAQRVGSLSPNAAAAGAPSGAVPAIPVPPPPGASRSTKNVTPFERIGSPYLTTDQRTYDAALTPQQVEAYYAPRLEAMGYTLSVTGQSCGPGRPCASDYGFRRGRNDEVDLTIAPAGARSSRYSIQIQVIVPPQRPSQSFVPAGVQSLAIEVRPQAGEGYTTTNVTSPSVIAHLRAIVNGLPVDTRGAHGCAVDTGERSVLVFTAGAKTYRFKENPACTSVGGPGVALEDTGALWNATVKAAGLAGLAR